MPLPDLAHLLPLVALLVLIGAFAGVIAGMLGVGGGIVLVPAFLHTFLGLGYGGPQIMQVCIATSLATIVFTSVRSMRGHAAKGAVDFAILRSWGPGIAVGAVVGVLVAGGLKSAVLMLIFGVLGTLVGLYIGFGRDDWRLGDRMPGGVGRAVTSAAIGFLSVLMGIGGGSFGVPLMRLYGMPIHKAVGTASGFGVMIAVPSVIGFLLTGWSIEGKPPLHCRPRQPAGVLRGDRGDDGDDHLGRPARARDESKAAEACLRGLHHADGAQHALQGAVGLGVAAAPGAAAAPRARA